MKVVRLPSGWCRVGRRILPSVTHILRTMGKVRGMRWYTPAARARGSSVAELSAREDQGEHVDWPPELAGYRRAWQAWRAKIGMHDFLGV